MFAANFATLMLAKAHLFAFWFFQDDASIGWDPIHLWKQMSWVAQAVVVILFIMSAWSIGVMIDRWIAFSAARKQSRQFAPVVAGALREGKLDEAIRVAERNKKSHLAKVVTPACRNSRRTANPRKFRASRLKPANAPWSAPKPSSTPS